MMDQDYAAIFAEGPLGGRMYDIRDLGVFLPAKCPIADSFRQYLEWDEEKGRFTTFEIPSFEFGPKVSVYVQLTGPAVGLLCSSLPLDSRHSLFTDPIFLFFSMRPVAIWK